MKPTRDDIALYAAGSYDGDIAALEAAIATDETLRAQLAEEARLEELLRDAAASAAFCPACADLVRADRCASCGTAVAPGGYTVERVLVANAHGRMYVARDADGKQVALKELAFVQSPGPDAIAAFEREAKFLRALEHPAIPRFCAAFEEGEGVHTRYYLAQELVTGEPLDARLEQHFYAETEIVEIAKQVLAVLVYLQGLSPMVIHRDIKPANLLRRADGSIALVDFGAAHVQGTTAGSTSIGTFGYMPIEQLAGQVDATTDPYALGATLVHLLTRQEPWRVMNAELIGTINVSLPMRRFLEKLVAPRREDRFPTAAAALAGLEDRGAIRRKRERPRWQPIAIAVAAMAALAGAGAAGFALRGGPGRPVPVATAGSDQNGGPLPDACIMYAAEVENIARCSALPMQTRQRFTAPLSSLMRMPILSEGSFMERSLACTSMLDALRAEALPACIGDEVMGVPPVPPVPPTPPTPPTPPVRGFTEPHAFLNPSKISTEFKAVPIAEALRFFGKACDANIVLPDSSQAKVTLALDKVPCDQAVEVLLEAHGLWYRYVPDAKLLEVLPRKELDQIDAMDAERARQGYADPVDLPNGPLVDLEMKDAPIQDVLHLLAMQAKVNIVIPDFIRGKLTVALAKVPWDVAIKGVLESHGLWYRYRTNGKVLRIAARKELDQEDAAARERERQGQ